MTATPPRPQPDDLRLEVERLRQVLISVMEGMEYACPEGERDVDKLRGGYFILYSQIKKALYPDAARPPTADGSGR